MVVEREEEEEEEKAARVRVELVCCSGRRDGRKRGSVRSYIFTSESPSTRVSRYTESVPVATHRVSQIIFQWPVPSWRIPTPPDLAARCGGEIKHGYHVLHNA